jgi:hypothetical protein
MKQQTFIIKEKAQELPLVSGWVYIPVPQRKFPGVRKTRWGLIPIQARVGNTSWKTSLLPMGGGSYFIALKAKVRKQEDIFIGDDVELHFHFQ